MISARPIADTRTELQSTEKLMGLLLFVCPDDWRLAKYLA
jgi:hypothetical protein